MGIGRVVLVSMAGLLALPATGCAVHTGAYVEPVAPVGYYGADGPATYYGAVAPVWREPVVVVHPRYYAPRPYVRVPPRYYAPRVHYHAYYRGGRHRW